MAAVAMASDQYSYKKGSSSCDSSSIYDKIFQAPTYDDDKKPNYGYQASSYDKLTYAHRTNAITLLC